jgi:folate-binding protein YgfZ
MDVTAAVGATGVDVGVAWHFGDPMREQRLLSAGAGLVDRSNRGVLIVPGADRLPWLHSICSQHVADLTDGDSTEALVLSPHGHVEQHWQLTELAGTVWLDVEPGTGAAALEYLQKMRFLKRVEPADVSHQWSVWSLVGPTADSALQIPVAGADSRPVPAADGVQVPTAGATALSGGGFVRRMPYGLDLVLPRASQLPARLDVGRAGLWAFEAHRVADRRPRLGFETDHRTIPHEVGWIGTAVHLDKGCYRGQETVARVQNLGRPPRRLVLLYLSGMSDALPPPGTPIELDGRAVGFLGTAIQHHELGPIALAVIKRSLPDTAALAVAGEPAAIG